MNDLIQNAMSSLGVSEDVAQSATGGLLQTIKTQADPGDFSQLLEKMPGADQLVKAVPETSGASAGGLLGKVASATGFGSGATGLASALGGSGLDAGKYGAFASLFIGYVKDKAGTELTDRVLGGVPFLKQLLV